jgi:ATP-dependent protease ClpP protease subunit
MKKLLIGLLLATTPVLASDVKHITLEAKNSVSLREEFTSGSVNTLKTALISLDQTLGDGERIYLYLDTPGGSVIAGKDLIEVIHGLKHPVDVIANFAASMGYLTTQGTSGKRYVTETGVLMSHRATVGAEGTIPGNFETRVNFYKEMTNNLSSMAADRTGITLKAYQERVREEYWREGADAVKENQADGVVTVSCSADLSGTTTETLFTMFGPVGVVWSNCPLISVPVAIEFGGANISTELQNTITEGLLNKQALISSPALEESYLRLIK